MTSRRSVRGLLFAATLVLSAAAGAVTPGGILYVRVKDAKLLSAPSLTANPLGVLQPGTKVTWRGADPKSRQLHKVEVTQNGTKLEGYVLQANLSPREPATEVLVSNGGKPIDAQAFKSSGAAIKGLGGIAFDYAAARHLTGLPERLQALETISASVDGAAVTARARSLGLAAGDEAAAEAAPEAGPPEKKAKKSGKAKKKKKGAAK